MRSTSIPTLALVLTATILAACSSSAPTSPSATDAPPPSAEATAVPPSAGATAVPPASAEPSSPAGEPTTAAATLTPFVPQPDVSMVATWWLDPSMLPVDPAATTLHGFVLEKECASGRSPEGRIVTPDVDYGADALTITVSVAPLGGAQDCQGNAPFGIVFELEEAVGGRPIFDGGTVPARDATIPGS